MNLYDLFLIASGLSMDAFAASVCKGMAIKSRRFRAAWICGLYFSVFQSGMPLLGYLLSRRIGRSFHAVSPYIVFVLLAMVGTGMINHSRSHAVMDNDDSALSLSSMLPLAVATSIDALAAGVSFSLLHVHIPTALFIIAAVTFVLCAAGTSLGSLLGHRLQSAAQIAGGSILILMGFRILFSHLLS